MVGLIWARGQLTKSYEKTPDNSRRMDREVLHDGEARSTKREADKPAGWAGSV